MRIEMKGRGTAQEIREKGLLGTATELNLIDENYCPCERICNNCGACLDCDICFCKRVQ